MLLKSLSEEETIEFGWWVEVVTALPHCTYYFGAFETSKEAQLSQAGYIEELEQEGAKGITFQIRECKPRKLTICKDELDGV